MDMIDKQRMPNLPELTLSACEPIRLLTPSATLGCIYKYFSATSFIPNTQHHLALASHLKPF